MAYIDLQSLTSSTFSVYMSNISDINKLYEDYENDYDMSGFSFVLDWYISVPITDYNLSVGSYNGTWEKVGSQQYSYSKFQDLVYYVSDKNKTDVFNIVDLPPQSKMFVQCVVYVRDSGGILNKYTYRNSGTGNSEYYQSVFKSEYWTDEAPINFSSRTPNSISIYISNLDTSYDGIGRKVTWIVNNVEVGEQSIPNQINQTTPYEIPGLEPGKKYSITYKILSANKYTSCDLTPVEYWTAATPYIQFMSSDETSITARIVINDGSYYNNILSNPKIKWYYSTNPSTFSGSADYIDTSYHTTNGVATFSNLVSSTRYYFKCEILSSNESQNYYTTTETRLSDGNTPSDGFMTTDTGGGGGIDPTKPYINYMSCTNSSITVNVTNMAKVYKDPYVVFIHYSTDSEFTNYNKVAHNLGLSESAQGYTNNIIVSGLAANTTYYLKCEVYMEGQYMYTSGNYITVTTADQNGNGGGLGTGGGGGDTPITPPVDPTAPVIEIVNREEGWVNVKLTNIPKYSSTAYVHWFASETSPVVFNSNVTYQGTQAIYANNTSSEIYEINTPQTYSNYYIDCVITNSVQYPDFNKPSSILCNNIAEVLSRYNTYTIQPYEGSDSIFTIDAEDKSFYISGVICDSFGNVASFYEGDTCYAALYLDGYNDENKIGDTTWYDGNSGFDLYVDYSAKWDELGEQEHTLLLVVDANGESAETSCTFSLTLPTSRPENWQWITNVSKGAIIPFENGEFHPLTAAEWNDFTDRINQLCQYRNLPNYNFTAVVKGQDFTKAIYNEAVLALNDMFSGESLLEEATSDNVVNAFAASTYLNLSDRLNSLINNL